jgi:hypothetical protein
MSAIEGAEPSDEELRAEWEEQLRLLTPADVIAQTLVSLVTLAGRRIGLEPGHEQERDLAQVRDAIDGARALLPILERGADGGQLGPLREAISALQLEYAKLVGGAAGAGSGAPSPPPPVAPPRATAAQEPPDDGEEGPGPAQRSGRLWVPGS